MPHTSQQGAWNAVCDVCGIVRSSTQIIERWDRLMVCRKHWEPRQPQDFVRGIPDPQTLPWTRPEVDPVFLHKAPAYSSTIVFPQAVNGEITPDKYTDPTLVWGQIPDIVNFVGAVWTMNFSLTPSDTPFTPDQIIGTTTGIVSNADVGFGAIQTSWSAAQPSTLAAQLTLSVNGSTPSSVINLLDTAGNLFSSNSVNIDSGACTPTSWVLTTSAPALMASYYLTYQVSGYPVRTIQFTNFANRYPDLMSSDFSTIAPTFGNLIKYLGAGSCYFRDPHDEATFEVDGLSGDIESNSINLTFMLTPDLPDGSIDWVANNNGGLPFTVHSCGLSTNS